MLSVAHITAPPQERLTDIDHDLIVAEAVAALRREYAEHPDPARLLGESFTVLDLHRTHVAIDPTTAHKDAFRRAMLQQLVETDQMELGIVGKPAKLFRRA
ncbi:hypothetical protein BAURA63_03572 [Brevibacterium aurantiacum]|uniref:NrtR DNA-binding winged helix domain-containing protein n=1 Tax=Brevibacterium aurantiacum TaxID=273384 RepID=A0A2H1KQ31_BREAU|nr:hypothetical protein BAURA63_03572 [Brevibacterium aurantiacum]